MITRTRKIPAMVSITITGEDDSTYQALRKAMIKENRRRQEQGLEPLPYTICQIPSSIRPSISPQSIESTNSDGSTPSI